MVEPDPWHAAATADRLPPGWRRHCRAAHLRLVARWLGTGGPEGAWLKTDLFEETSPTRALVSALPSAWWTAMDVSPRVAASAAPVVGARAVAADVTSIPFRGASFDGVLSTSTLDHLSSAAEIEVALRELRRVLRPGGHLILTLDNPTNPLVRIRNALPVGWQRRSGLVAFPLGATLGRTAGSAALSRSGFVVEDTAYLLHAPHVVGTRLARFAWWERHALPAFDRLGGSRVAAATGHFVAFLARVA